MNLQTLNAKESLEIFLAYRARRISKNFHRDSSLVLYAWSRETGLQSVRDLSTEQLQDWFDLKCRTVKVSTAASYLTWVRVFLDWCVKRGVRFDNPADAVEIPRFGKPFRKVFVSKATVKRLIDECLDPELKYCLFGGFHAGLRFNEVVMSRPEWFDLAEGLLHITRCEEWRTKDDTDRTVPLTDEFAAFLRVYGLRVPYMVGGKACGTKRYRFTFRKRFERYVRGKGVLITYHDLRRTFCQSPCQLRNIHFQGRKVDR